MCGWAHSAHNRVGEGNSGLRSWVGDGMGNLSDFINAAGNKVPVD